MNDNQTRSELILALTKLCSDTAQSGRLDVYVESRGGGSDYVGPYEIHLQFGEGCLHPVSKGAF